MRSLLRSCNVLRGLALVLAGSLALDAAGLVSVSSVSPAGPSAPYGTGVTLTVEVANVETGRVEFHDLVPGGADLTVDTQPISPSHLSIHTYTNLAPGLHHLYARCISGATTGDAGLDYTITKTDLALTLALAAGQTGVLGDTPCLVTVAFTYAGPAKPGQTVTFTDQPKPGTVIPLGSWTADPDHPDVSFTLPGGPHTLTATYDAAGQDPCYNGASATLTFLADPANLAGWTLTATPSSLVFGNTVSLTAAATGRVIQPTGLVSLYDGGGILLGQGTLAPAAATSATFTVDGLKPRPGTTYRAVYGGDATFLGQTAQAAPGVAPAASSTSLSLSSVVAGQPLTLTALVSGSVSGTPPTGQATCFDGATPVGSAVTLANGQAAWTLPALAAGAHAFSVQYPGDANYAGSSASQQIDAPAATVLLTADPAAATLGQAVTFTAQVGPGATGAVTFMDGGAALGSVDLAGGLASLTTAALGVGTHALAATYAGDATHPYGTGSLSYTVGPKPGQLALAASPSPATYGQAVTLTATLDAADAAGDITFLDGTHTLGTAALAGGRGVFSAAGLGAGTHSLTASYGGDATHAGATSAPASLDVAKATPVLAWATPAAVPEGTLLGPDQLNASADVAGSFAYAPPAGTPLLPGPGQASPVTLSVTFTPADAANYAPATATVQLALLPALAPDLTVSALSDGALTSALLANVSGTVTGEGTRVAINGQAVPVDPDGGFSWAVRLKEGPTPITTVALGATGLSRQDVRTLTLDTGAAHLRIHEPADTSVVAPASVEVTGDWRPSARSGHLASLAWTLNGGPPQPATVTEDAFSFTVTLAPGLNTVELTGTGADGVAVRAKRTLTQAPGFSLAATLPGEDPLTAGDTATLRGGAADAGSPVQVTVSLDGQPLQTAQDRFVQGLAFPQAGVFSATLLGDDGLGNVRRAHRTFVRAAAIAPASFTLADVLRVLRIVDGLVQPTPDDYLRFNLAPMVGGIPVGDGRIDIDDAALVLDLALGVW